MAADDSEPIYACKCLNIRLWQKPLPTDKEIQQACPSPAEQYEALYVGEEGVNVVHNEMTLRTRSSVLSSSETQRKQHITVTCLVCNISVYRVLVVVPPDIEARFGPILPTEDWMEQDVLLGSTGWIEVHIGKSGCIGKQDIKQLISSPSYLQRYSLALVDVPQDHLTSTTPILPETKITVPHTHNFMPELPPFLPPPPFTPSHPIFLHLASIATAASDAFRKAARTNIEDFTRRELTKVEDQECQLKAQVEHLWRNIRECLNKAQKEKDASLLASMKAKRRSTSPGSRSSTPDGPDSFIVRSFIPTAQNLPRHLTSASAPQHSALSSSLRTSPLHHLSVQQSNVNGQATNGIGSHTNNASLGTVLPLAGSSSSPPEGLTIVSRSLHRNMDMENDTAVTYKWSLIEEEERKARERKKREKEAASVVDASAENKKTSSQKKPEVSAAPVTKVAIPTPPSDLLASSLKNSQRKSPGKRKVTFNIEPNVVTIKGNERVDDDHANVVEGNEDLIFDLDNIDAESSSPVVHQKNGVNAKDPKGQASRLVFASDKSERPRRNVRHTNTANVNNLGLSSSFAALRPASLPVPSNIRNNMHASGSSARPPQSASPPKGIHSRINEGSSSDAMSISESHLPYQKELLKLLGADTPIHRGSWGPDSDSWKIFDSTKDKGKGRATEDEDVELDQSDKNDAVWRQYQMPGVASSLPLPMAPISQRVNGAKLAGQKPSVSSKFGTLPTALASVNEEDEKRSSRSAVANRREAYAERDRTRSLDPGILEFIPDSDGGEEGSQSDQSDEDLNQVPLSRSQRSALKIIKAADSLPAEGMWRSLAS